MIMSLVQLHSCHLLEILFSYFVPFMQVNRLRYWMSISMYTEEGEDNPEAGRHGVIKCQNKVKEILFE